MGTVPADLSYKDQLVNLLHLDSKIVTRVFRMIKIKDLLKSDINLAKELTDQVEWGNSIEDWKLSLIHI